MKAGHGAARRLRAVPYATRYVVNAYPALYMPLARVRHRHRDDWAVGRETELVIEGFGRSGSTFAVDAFELAQRRPVRLAHHTHAAAQVIAAARMGVPILLIVRRPEEVVPSHMARRGIPAGPALRAWVRYHERVLPHNDGLVAVPFETLTTDFGSAIRELNARFGTDFDEFEHTRENEARVFELIEQRNRGRFGSGSEQGARSLARPTPEREAQKVALRAEYESERLARLRARASSIYGALFPAPPGPS